MPAASVLKTVVVSRRLITLKTHTCRHAGKGEVNNSYCNNGVLVGAELVLQLVTTNKEIHLFPTCPSSLICHAHVFFSLYDLSPYSLASPTDMPLCVANGERL